MEAYSNRTVWQMQRLIIIVRIFVRHWPPRSFAVADINCQGHSLETMGITLVWKWGHSIPFPSSTFHFPTPLPWSTTTTSTFIRSYHRQLYWSGAL